LLSGDGEGLQFAIQNGSHGLGDAKNHGQQLATAVEPLLYVHDLLLKAHPLGQAENAEVT
jgi:hypothetical protein